MRKNRSKTQTLSLPFRLIYARFSVIIWGGLAIIFMLISMAASERVNHARLEFVNAATPVVNTVTAPFQALSAIVSDMTGVGTLRSENLRLTEENARLREWYQAALKLEAENKSLRDFLNVTAEPDRAYLTTRVMSDAGGRYVHSFLIPAGTSEGVENGQAVITKNGLIGRVLDSASQSARVLLITDLNSRIPVMIEKTHHRAILAGTNGNEMTLNHLPNDSGISVGARIVTSGHEGILPPNIPIGTVRAIENGVVTIAPLADLERLHFVQVVAYTAPGFAE